MNSFSPGSVTQLTPLRAEPSVVMQMKGQQTAQQLFSSGNRAFNFQIGTQNTSSNKQSTPRVNNSSSVPPSNESLPSNQ